MVQRPLVATRSRVRCPLVCSSRLSWRRTTGNTKLRLRVDSTRDKQRLRFPWRSCQSWFTRHASHGSNARKQIRKSVRALARWIKVHGWTLWKMDFPSRVIDETKTRRWNTRLQKRLKKTSRRDEFVSRASSTKTWVINRDTRART